MKGRLFKAQVTKVAAQLILAAVISATFLSAVRAEAGQAPVIQKFSIVPAYPKAKSEIAAVALVSDADKDLKVAGFYWYKNNQLVQTGSVAISGGEASPKHELSGIKCNVRVSDNAGNLVKAWDKAMIMANYRLPGLCFSPYKAGQSPGTYISETQIRQLLKIIAPFTRSIRTYAMRDGLENSPRIAKKEFGLKVSAGIWLDANEEANEEGLTKSNASTSRLLTSPGNGKAASGRIGAFGTPRV